MNAQAFDQYRKATVETVASEKLLIMLYNGAINKISNAKKAIEEQDINRAHLEIMKTEEIIIELMSTLNMDYEISNGLFSLYEYLYNQLVQANVKKDIELLEEVKGFLCELRDTWQEALKTIKTAVPAPVELLEKVSEPVIAPKTDSVTGSANVSGPVSINNLAYGSGTATKTFSNSPPNQRQSINING
jgi:flagellar protein FliS